MDIKEDRPDVRYWTAYDHFMVEREAREMRRRYVYAMMRGYWKSATRRVAQAFKHAGAQPRQRTPA